MNSELMNLIDNYKTQVSKIESLEQHLKEAKRERDLCSDAIVEEMNSSGVRSLNMNDGLNVHIRTDRFVSKKASCSKEQVCRWLEQVGCEEFIETGYNAARIKSLVLEMKDEGLEVPDDIFNFSEKTKVTLRKG